jgi:hypothetical protein
MSNSAPTASSSQPPPPNTAEQAFQMTQQMLREQHVRMEQMMHENQLLHTRIAAMEHKSDGTATAAASPLSLPRLAAPSKPDTYNGSRRVSADVYLFNLKTYFKAIGVVQEEQQINFIAAQLRDSAATWWRRVCATEANKPSTWEQFESAFIKQFTPVASKETARYTLHAMKQRGAAVGYCDAFSTCLLQFEEGDVSEGEQLFMFTCGLNKELQQQVRLMRPKTLDEAMSYAVQIEAENRNYSRVSNAGAGRGEQHGAYQHRTGFQRQTNGQQGPTPMELGNLGTGSEAYQDGSSIDDEEGELNAVATRRQLSPDQVKEYMRKGICFVCAKSGHLARNCPTRTTQPQTQQRSKNP